VSNIPKPKYPLDLSKKPLIGMIHLPSFESIFSLDFNFDETFRISITDALTLKQAGFDALLIENFHDTPFPKSHISDSKLLLISKIVNKINESVSSISIGVNILRNACAQALKVATFNEASFIRCNIWEGAYVTDQGMIEGIAHEVIHLRNSLHSEVKILADVGVKHATPLGQFSLQEAARNAFYRGKADAIILSGKETGKLISLNQLEQFVRETEFKPILGSGLDETNLESVFPFISGAIVGSSLKYEPKNLRSPIDLEKATSLMKHWQILRDSGE
jgi:membrane complex biogenesis BtpA family protein